MKKLSNILFYIALAVSAYTLISTYMVRRSLPEGVCPIDSRSELYYISIALLIISLILSFFDQKKKA
jgi:uncharacterized membrane protein YtjA (UPF0391 family)